MFLQGQQLEDWSCPRAKYYPLLVNMLGMCFIWLVIDTILGTSTGMYLVSKKHCFATGVFSFLLFRLHCGYLLHSADKIRYAFDFSLNRSQYNQTQCKLLLEMQNRGYPFEYHLRRLLWPQIPDIHLQLVPLPRSANYLRIPLLLEYREFVSIGDWDTCPKHVVAIQPFRLAAEDDVNKGLSQAVGSILVL